ncbi:hypothetical protein FNV43_RR13153 [Rhamnella rubrinervis]|uniref:NAD(P)-binding domain-containing protein n=1 Tax=Rhamnella rubrinervis TaxID=2594499 RepID=A0A8K0H0J8_9ROSA|nr:hypothetical protein FNV43_RR13153 [Rhamnella rubrinervis]
MAATLTSHSVLLTSTPNSKLNLKTRRLRVFAKRAGPFSFGQRNSDSSDEGEAEGKKTSTNSSPFRFDFGKVGDVKSLIPVVSNPSPGLSFGSSRRKDPGTVFVSGAAGQAGIRIAQSLLREGFSVRAGVPDLGAAQDLARVAVKYKIISNEESKRLNAVESSFQDAESIAKAIGNASKVVVTIGPAENGPTSEVTTSDALQVIQAADLAGVGHVAIIYDGNTAGTSTYNVLDGLSSFFYNFFSRSQPLSVPEFLQKVIETNVSYTFIKTSLTHDYSPESGYNVVVSAEGSAGSHFSNCISGCQCFSNTAVAENKVVEVFTDPSAPLKPVDGLFSAIPEDGRRKAYAEKVAKAKAEEEAKIAAEKAQEAAEAAKKLEDEVKKLSDQEARAATLAQDAQLKAEAAGASIEGMLSKAKGIGSGFSWDKLSAQLASSVQTKPKETPKVQVATVRGQAKARALPPLKAIVKQTGARFGASSKPPKEEPKPKGKQTNVEKRKVLGGLFTQETIYVDED